MLAAIRDLASAVSSVAESQKIVSTTRPKESSSNVEDESLARAFRHAGGTAAIGAIVTAFEGDIVAVRTRIEEAANQAIKDCRDGGALTLTQTCAYLKMGETRVRSLVKRGKLKTIVDDRRVRFRRVELDRFLAENER
jgi:excisionase family DNA binding protein